MQKSFIETQFPVSKLSKESFKERKAVQSQTLTGLGKWWGRKPLVLVRAAVLGSLLPATNNPAKDREVFLKLMTMDNDGLWERKVKSIPTDEVYNSLPPADRELYFDVAVTGKVKYKRNTSAEIKESHQYLLFSQMTYDEKLELCDRPENIAGPSEKSWDEINSYLSTHATCLSEFIQEIGKRVYGHTPRVGDAFCGGGSVPFEAARIGCDAFASDLNPVATLLTWSALNIIGGGEDVAKQVAAAQESVYNAVDKQVCEWGIEHNESGWRADAFLYCTETTCPECGWTVPLLPTFMVGPTSRCFASLTPEEDNKKFKISIINDATPAQLKDAAISGTIKSSELICPHCETRTPISTIRGDKDGTNSLRRWENTDISHRQTDIFKERLYCIRWVETYIDEFGSEKTKRHFRDISEADNARENLVCQLLSTKLLDWQEQGFIPSSPIETGYNTNQPIRERAWMFWNNLFTPRQLLLHGLLMEITAASNISLTGKIASLLGVGRCCDWNSRLCRWGVGAARESIAQTYYNQALNTMFNYAGKGLTLLKGSYFIEYSPIELKHNIENFVVNVGDCRTVRVQQDMWITDPPYADAVNYHELTEFFLAWYGKQLVNLFPNWYADSKRALAVVGSDEGFRRSMVDCYRNLAEHMPENGIQVVMFTHQDAGVWADLALILWAAGLQVTAAWTIATETEAAGIKGGNYVQGTVLLVLRKRTSEEVAFLDDITQDIKPEVESQLKAMLEIEDKDDPNFSDSDYQLAAYAAALRVLTSYKQIEDLDVERELGRDRRRSDKSPIETIIENGVKIASNFLIPRSLHDDEITRRDLWRNLSPEERFYLKGLEVESHGDYRQGVYQEFAKGFGLREYTNMLESGKANETRLRTASEFKRRELGTPGFGSTLVRNILFAIYKAAETEKSDDAMRWLKDELPGDYWQLKQSIVNILRYISRLPIEHWKGDTYWAGILAGTVENDGV
jgi:adenine-specific DNA methylase